MRNPNTSCVGCDESTGGTYRPDANWSLCSSCYSGWQESQAEAEADEERLWKEAEAERQCDEYYDYSYGLPVK